MAMAVVASTAGPARSHGLPEQADEIKQHLEFLGYEVEVSEKHLFARHPQKLNVRITEYQGGVLFYAYYRTNEVGKAQRTALLEHVNEMNRASTMATFFIDRDGDLSISAWYTGDYERTSFGKFEHAWVESSWAVIDQHFTLIEQFLD
jgi:hypothetical protein